VPDKLKVGIVGCGGVVRQAHLPAFSKLNNVVVQAVCDKNQDLARQTALGHRIPGVYAEIADMLAKEKLDIVDICVPPQLHAAIALEALRAGCHILMEKPMALKVSDCDAMLEVAREKDRRICIVHNQLFNPPFYRARRLVAGGAIGELTGVRILLSDHRDEMIMKKDYWIHKLPGGVIGESGPHVVYLTLAFLGTVKSVDIHAKSFLEHPWAPFDEFRLELEGEKAMSSVVMSYATTRHDLLIDIMGTEGYIHIDLSGRFLVRYGSKTSVRPWHFARYFLSTRSQEAAGIAGNALGYLTGGLKLGHERLIKEFVASILSGGRPPVTGEEGREVVKVMEMIVARLNGKYGKEVGIG
jgi:UDP-N-acetyl-2-amino-2-deoxyglucuronate dehydrogenase